MNIIQIIPGSGGSFYCGNCLRDSKFFYALRDTGHEVTKIPMYLPLFSDEHDLSDIPVFYGAISTYLKQLYPIFRKAPAWFDKLLNSKPMLKLAASQAGSTRAKGLEDMTISMLLGEEGKQKDELHHMLNWMAEHCKPDIVHLSNALLLGLAGPIRERLQTKIVCSLQDEDVWVDVMHEGIRQKIWNLMSEKAKDVDLFISVSDYFKGVSLDRMQIPSEKIKIIHLGVDAADYSFKNATEKPRNIGYISRMNPDNGFDIVTEAFIQLKKQKGFDDVGLVLTGGHTGDDKKFIHQQKKLMAENNLMDKVEFIDEFEGEARQEFFNKVAVLSVPVKNGEAFGIYLTEALAAGIPVVQPKLGAFPEIVDISKGGLIYYPNTAEKLAESLALLFNNKDKLSQLSINGHRSIEDHFNIHKLSDKMIAEYQQLLT